jgi:hypothetical protein
MFLQQYTSLHLCINIIMTKRHDRDGRARLYHGTWEPLLLFFKEESTVHDQIISEFHTTLMNLGPMTYRKRIEQKRERLTSSHHYSSPAPSGGLRATHGCTLDDRDSDAR